MSGQGRLKKLILLSAFAVYGLIYLLLAQVSLEPVHRKASVARKNESIEDWANKILVEQFSITTGLDGLKLLALESVSRDKEDRVLDDKLVRIHAALEAGHSIRKAQPKQRTIQKYSRPGKSLAFIKAYKVGGTLISSLLSTYVYNYDLNVDPSGVWSMDGVSEQKYNSCVDVAGTQHPKPGFYKNMRQDYVQSHFCNDPIIFMFIRNPLERLWSAYNHYLRLRVSKSSIQASHFQVGQGMLIDASKGRQRPSRLDQVNSLKGHELEYGLVTFLRTDTILARSAPHNLLAKSLSQATSLLPNITIFSSDEGHMDESLILLTQKSDLDMCDILYEPCTERDNLWSTSKCNDRKVPLNESLTKILQSHAGASEELTFYNLAMARFREEIQKPNIQKKLEQYVNMRDKTLKACSTLTGYMAWESVFFADPLVRRSEDNRWVVEGEDYYSIIPTWVCMQTLCRKMVGDSEHW